MASLLDISTYSHDTRLQDLRDSVDRLGAVFVRGVEPTESAILLYARTLGSPNLEVPEVLCGPPVMHLRFDRDRSTAASRQAYFTCGEFPLHTDLSYVPNPPRYLLALCVEADAGGGGLCTLASLESAWQTLSDDDRECLSQRCFAFDNAPNTGDGACQDQSIYEPIDNRGIWRYRPDTLTFPDSAKRSVERFSVALEDSKSTLQLCPGDLMILDNHRFAHGRTAFQAPSARHILRSYADPGNY